MILSQQLVKQNIDSADALVYNGLGIENWITKISPTHKIDASKGLNVSYSDKRNMTLDPHVWLDPLLAKASRKHTGWPNDN